MVEDKYASPPKNPSEHYAIVLPGAVARGAYEAGVIHALAESDVQIDRIVATSSGALNGLALAAGIRAGREKEMSEKLVQSWIEDGGWQNSLNLSPWSLFTGRGLSTKDGLLKMMRAMIHPNKSKIRKPVDFRVIVTPLNGIVGTIGEREATTYEHVVEFKGKHFDSEEGLEEMFNVVCAACAFPGLFEPVQIPGFGACVDGGAVNNAPIGYALKDSNVNRVLMPVPYPAIMPKGDWRRGFGLFNHLIAILINERLYRDLKIAQSVNVECMALEKLKKKGILSSEQLDEVKAAISLRHIEITEIRPPHDFKCSPFSGFFHKKDRVRLVEQGRMAALNTLGIQSPLSMST